MVKQTSEIKTADLNLAAFLNCKGFKYSRPPEKFTNNLITFFYPETEEIKNACRDFLSRATLVEPLALLECFRIVKATTWQIKREVQE